MARKLWRKLATAEEIAKLMPVSVQAVTKQPVIRRPNPRDAASKRNCPCGHCRYCVENARWERIWKAHGHDREMEEYYAPRPVPVPTTSWMDDPRGILPARIPGRR